MEKTMENEKGRGDNTGFVGFPQDPPILPSPRFPIT